MATLKFYIRPSKKSETATIRLYFSAKRNSIIYAITPFVIPVNVWDEKKQTIKKGAKFDLLFTPDSAQFIITKLQDIETEVFSKFSFLTTDPEKDWLQNTIDLYLNPPQQDKPDRKSVV